MNNIEKMAWQLLCEERKGGLHQFDFWGEVGTDTQEAYVIKAKHILGSIDSNIINGNWTTAIELVVKHRGVKLVMLDQLTTEDKLILADYVIAELRSEKGVLLQVQTKYAELSMLDRPSND